MSYLLTKLKEESLFFIILSFTLVTCLFRLPAIESINFSVLMALSNLMLISAALESQNVLESVAITIIKHKNTERSISLTMIGITSVLAMFLTNDVALITMVPITIIASKKGSFDPYKIVIYETLAANIGSSLTPFGNPQNIYLYNYYGLNFISFLRTMLPFVSVGMIILACISFKTSTQPLVFNITSAKIKSFPKTIYYFLLLFLVLLSIAHIISDFHVSLIVFISILILDGELIKKIDFFLLGTFVLFFFFVDNLMAFLPSAHHLTQLINSPSKTILVGFLTSQVLSNVPSAILFSPFAANPTALLYGVSLGGFGTLIASLANLIAYKLYSKEFKNPQYMKYFLMVNIIMIIILLPFTLWISQ